MSVKVAVADDHALFRSILKNVLTSTDDIEVVAECSDGHQAVAAGTQISPDIVLMDLQMPTMSGMEATRELLAAHPHMRVTVLPTPLPRRLLRPGLRERSATCSRGMTSTTVGSRQNGRLRRHGVESSSGGQSRPDPHVTSGA